MKSAKDKHVSIVVERLTDIRKEVSEFQETLSKHLADSLAGADKDMRHFIEKDPETLSGHDSIADRMRIRAAEFEADHPRMSELLREVAELIRGMGI